MAMLREWTQIIIRIIKSRIFFFGPVARFFCLGWTTETEQKAERRRGEKKVFFVLFHGLRLYSSLINFLKWGTVSYWNFYDSLRLFILILILFLHIQWFILWHKLWMCEQGVYVSHKVYINVQWLFNLIACIYVARKLRRCYNYNCERTATKRACSGWGKQNTALKMPFRLQALLLFT